MNNFYKTLGAASLAASLGSNAATESPNVLFVVVDDMGYSDLSKFGSEIPTPHLDQLANQSLIMSNMQTAPTCSPSRAMLWTGVDNHKAGLGNMLEEMAPNQQGKPGYEGMINRNVVLISETLQQQGYETFYVGKWHLSKGAESRAFDRGFSHTFALNSGGASHYRDMKPAYAPTPDAKAPYSENGKLIETLPENFTYSTQFYADKAIEYIEATKDKPFFGVLSFTAPHWPLQAPDEIVAKYRGKYDKGYEVLYEQRYNQQKALGFIPAETRPTKIFPEGKRWADLTEQEKKVEIRAMEIYAAMIDQVDSYTGKVINKLKQLDKYDNTLIVFLSDNGVEGHTLDEIWPMDQFPKIRTTIDNSHDFSYENMGKENSYAILGPNWARAASPGFYMFKGYPHLGGTQVVSFIKYPHKNLKGEMSDSLSTIKDIAPTVLAVTDMTEAHTKNIGDDHYPISGRSLLAPPSPEGRVVITELFGKVSVNDGKWMLVGNMLDTAADWQLYNVEKDTSSREDLSRKHPAVVERLNQAWLAYRSDNHIIIPDWVSGY
ncbi:arylsulfatase [Photobacterium sp. ZSDE20]|uniref:Arylsulfatase n=1 Tax=Photobacterium pectinilyticum TaxID=2906793 RepID=A0ABT1N7Z5_9GAMM|nr:arylsulfatase [Photobacterium sp. ZSDE20]MCQ1060870.1 arylsulfatase [Photobacterium sp. ZSDE20]MDD1828738.1 arylsulfatase [Photobacterium sp. ZSDE20]